MKNIIKIIQIGAILGLSMFAFTSEVFAAPSLLPTSVVEITDTSAVLQGYAQSSDERSVVWLEWSEASSVTAPTVAGMRGFFGDGFFATRIEGLTPGTMYSFRAAIKGGGATVYSPIVSFKTSGGASVATVVSSQSPLGVGTLSGTGTTNVSSASHTQAASTGSRQISSTNKNTTAETVVAKNTTNTTSVNYSRNINSGAVINTTDSNAASAIGAGSSMFPDTLIGWIALLISLLFIILIVHMIYEQGEQRKKKSLPHEMEMNRVMA